MNSIEKIKDLIETYYSFANKTNISYLLFFSLLVLSVIISIILTVKQYKKNYVISVGKSKFKAFLSVVSYSVPVFFSLSIIQYLIVLLINSRWTKVMIPLAIVITVGVLSFIIGRVSHSEKPLNYEKIDKVAFVNNPIKSTNEDIIGFSSEISSLKSAINNGANIIGLIAGFGAGKSSLIDLLVESSGYGKPIVINMWNTESSENDTGKANNISKKFEMELIKTFLFQLASGVLDLNGFKSSFARSINNRLSKNYGLLSVSSSKRSYPQFIAAIVFIALSIGLKSGIEKDVSVWIYAFLFMFGVLFAIWGITQSVISFSSWKADTKTEIEMNDIFDIFMDVVNELATYRKGIIVVVIEDLDRITNSKYTEDFLNLLYRFFNLMPQKLKERFVFIVSVKPETEISNGNKDLYRKIFDYSISLNPIHNEDYGFVLEKLLSNVDKELLKKAGIDFSKEKAERDKDLHYIIHGENLTIRDIKTRLNNAINLYTTLVEKSYDLGKNDASISFQTCAIVSYLEQTYPKEFQILLKNEPGFRVIVETSYNVRYSNSEDKTVDSIKETIVSQLNNKNSSWLSESFCYDLSGFLFNGLIADDYRMYFYNYPKGSYIKSSDEKDITNAILYPDKYVSIDNEKVTKVLNEKDDDSINEALQSRIASGFVLPKSVITNEELMNLAYRIDRDKTMESVLYWVDWKDRNRSNDVFGTIIDFNKYPSSSKILDQLILSLSRREENYLQMRSDILEIIGIGHLSMVGVEWHNFNSLYFPVKDDDGKLSYSVPFISDKEISIIGDLSVLVQLINLDAITKENYYSAAKKLTSKIDNEELVGEISYIFKEFIKRIDNVSLPIHVFYFLLNNSLPDTELFSYLRKHYKQSKIQKKDVIGYINSLDVNTIPNSFIAEIDKCKFDNDLNNKVLELLYKSKYYYSVINCNPSIINFNIEENCKAVIDEVANNEGINDSVVINLRKEVIKQGVDATKSLNGLFVSAEQPLITKEELNAVKDFSEALALINCEKITIDNCNLIIDFCNSKTDLSEKDIFNIFDYLFNVEQYPDNSISDPDIIEEIIFGLNYEIIKFKELSEIQKNNIIEVLEQSINIKNTEQSISFMEHVDSIIPCLEEQFRSKKLLDEYINLINSVSVYTSKTVDILASFQTLDVNLPQTIYEDLYNYGIYKTAIISELRNTNSLKIREDVPFEEYAEVYNCFDSVYGYMLNNDDFVSKYLNSEYVYDGSKPNRLYSLCHYPQPFIAIEYAYENFDDEAFEQYFSRDWKIQHGPLGNNDDSESVAFYEFLKLDDNYKKLTTPELRRSVQMKIWKRQQRSHLTHLFNEWIGDKNLVYPDNGIGD